jgi:two-component system OmpR family response regulator
VLIIGNDRYVRQVLEVFIRLEGCEVETVCDDARALTVEAEWRPHLILLDLDWSEGAPFRNILTHRAIAGPGAPIILVSDVKLPDDRVAELGADGWLPKPFAISDLFAFLDQYAPCS